MTWRNNDEVRALQALPVEDRVRLLQDLIFDTEDDGIHYEGDIHEIGCLALDLFGGPRG